MIDRYTKVILTIIAASLVVIAIRGPLSIATATAQAGQTHVIIDSVSAYAFQFTTVPVRITQ